MATPGGSSSLFLRWQYSKRREEERFVVFGADMAVDPDDPLLVVGVLMNWNALSSSPISQINMRTPVVFALVNQLSFGPCRSSSRTTHNLT